MMPTWKFVLILVSCIILVFTLFVGGAMWFDKTACETKQEHQADWLQDREWHFPAGCIWVNERQR